MKFLKILRNWFLRTVRFRRYTIGKGFYCGRGVNLWSPESLIIGRNFYIGRYSFVECDAFIGNNVIFGNFVSLVGRFDHQFDLVGVPISFSPAIRQPAYEWKGRGLRIIVQDDVWVGAGTTIVSGVVVGRCAIVAAGSVVVKDVPQFAIVAGVPARVVGFRFDTDAERQAHLQKMNHFLERADEIPCPYYNW